MGTNYYWRPPSRACAACGHDPAEEDELHVGKSSAGWAFALHIHPERGIRTLEDWDRLWEMPGSRLRDEYGKTITRADMRGWTFDRSPRWGDKPRLRHVRSTGMGITDDAPPDPSGAPVDLCDWNFS